MRPLYWILGAGAVLLGWRAYRAAKETAAQIAKTQAKRAELTDLGRANAYDQNIRSHLGSYSPAELEMRETMENERLNTSFGGSRIWEPSGPELPQFESALAAQHIQGQQLAKLIDSQLRSA